MNVTFAPRDILQIDDARIIYRNFTGRGGQYNKEGDRNFAVIIDDEALADELAELGWNVKIKPPREENDVPFMYMNVKVKFNNRGPHVYLISGNNKIVLPEEEVNILDDIDIAGVDMDIRPYDWEVNEKSGRSAYLQSIRVTQRLDRFSEDDAIFDEQPWIED